MYRKNVGSVIAKRAGWTLVATRVQIFLVETSAGGYTKPLYHLLCLVLPSLVAITTKGEKLGFDFYIDEYLNIA